MNSYCCMFMQPIGNVLTELERNRFVDDCVGVHDFVDVRGCMNLFPCTHTHTERERETERERHLPTYLPIHHHTYNSCADCDSLQLRLDMLSTFGSGLLHPQPATTHCSLSPYMKLVCIHLFFSSYPTPTADTGANANGTLFLCVSHAGPEFSQGA